MIPAHTCHVLGQVEVANLELSVAPFIEEGRTKALSEVAEHVARAWNDNPKRQGVSRSGNLNELHRLEPWTSFDALIPRVHAVLSAVLPALHSCWLKKNEKPLMDPGAWYAEVNHETWGEYDRNGTRAYFVQRFYTYLPNACYRTVPGALRSP